MYRILYVDDEEHLLNAGKLYLERTSGFSVTPALSAIEGLEILKAGSFDAIVSDFQMPKMDGIEFLKEVRLTFGTIPFILFTGKGREEIIIQALNEGADFYLQKGGGPKAQFTELMHKISIAVERNRAKDELRESERRFQTLLDSIPNISVQGYGPDGIVNYWNKANELLYGYTAEEAVGKNIVDLIVPLEMREIIRQEIGRSSVTGVMPPASEKYLVHKNGTRIPVYSSHVMLPHPGHEPDFFCLDIDMTRQKEAEAALRESEEKYRNLVNNIQDMVWETTADLRITYVSPSQERITGYPIDEMIGHSLIDLLTPASALDVRNRLTSHRDKAMSGSAGQSRVFVIEGKKKDGGTIWMEVSSSPILGPDGTLAGFRGVNRDISERISNEAALRESRKSAEESYLLFKTLLDHAPIGFAYLDTSYRFVHVNENIAKISGFTVSECLGRAVEEVVPDIWPKVKDDLSRILETGISITNRELECRTQANPGETRFWITSSYPIRMDGAEIIGLGLIVIDITERKRIELKLNESGMRFQNIYSKSPIAIESFTREGTLIDINEAGCALFGITSPDAVKGFRLFDDPNIPPDQSGLLKNGKTIRYESDFDFDLVNRLGLYPTTRSGRISLDVLITPVKDKDCRISEYLVQVIDITERKRAENALRIANQKLNLLSGITRHDIRNQLFSLDAYLELTRDSLGDRATTAENIAQAEQISATIGRQILFTKEYETLGIKAPAWQNPDTGIKTAAAWLDLKGLRLEITGCESVEILADPLLEKVFFNLLDNARRHSGGAARSIRFSAHESKDGLVLVCEDDGIGVPVEDKDLIFSRGYGKNSGFGLFLIREILAITGILITETGVPGKGARFEIAVPKGAYRFTGTGRE
ncbi:PAS domain S-box protein [Methanoregula sp.]|uniref:response regulator n=1 Tax=Methanoregula sp. TaxID=2052170 RepID=UPI00356220D0